MRLGGRADWLPDVPRDDGLARQREVGSAADLARRLAALPAGHPSAITDSGKRAGEAARDQPDLDRHSNLADAGERGFWSKVGRFRELWQEHLARWPDKHDNADGPGRRDDPTGSWRGGGDRYLSPEQNAEADKQIEVLHKPEEAVTKLLQQIEHENPYGAVLVGLEHCRKRPDRIKEKLTDKMNAESGATVGDAAAMVDDAVRYTFCLGLDDYANAHDYVQRNLEWAGYKLTYRENHWLADPQYKGMNTRWRTPEGDRFELQFHTRESFYAKEELTHPSYRRLRSPSTTRAERLDLAEFERSVSTAVPVPLAASDIPSYRART